MIGCLRTRVRKHPIIALYYTTITLHRPAHATEHQQSQDTVRKSYRTFTVTRHPKDNLKPKQPALSSVVVNTKKGELAWRLPN